ncbi:MAG: hypothetical protein AAF530_24765 [Pseudomonadota bacterium]
MAESDSLHGANLDAHGERSIPTPAQVRAHLQFILNSAEFEKCRRLGEFLAFVVEETLAGRGERLKEHSIAQAVFHKNENFDPKINSIVRVEAGRLRNRLSTFYRRSGKDSKLRIDVPKGHYMARIKFVPPHAGSLSSKPGEHDNPDTISLKPADRRANRFWSAAVALCGFLAFGSVFYHDEVIPMVQEEPGPPGSPQSQTLSVFIGPLRALDEDSSDQQLAMALTHEIIASLARFKELTVLPQMQQKGSHKDGDGATQRDLDQEGFILEGSLRREAGDFRVALQLMDQTEGAILWAESYDLSGSQSASLDAQREVAGRVAGTLAGASGVILREAHITGVQNQPSGATPRDCLIQYYAYRNFGDAKSHRQARDCLIKAIAGAPGFSEGFAGLAILHLDEYRYGHNQKDKAKPALDRAWQAAQKAVAVDPQNARAHLAQALVHYSRDELDAFSAAAGRARELNPYDGDLLAELGNSYSFSGDWRRGETLVQDAKALNPTRPARYGFSDILNAYRLGDFDKAVTLAREFNAPDWYWTHAVRAMACGRVGDVKGSRLSKQKLLALKPDFPKKARAEFQRLGVHSKALIDEFIDGLRLAGLAITEPNGNPHVTRRLWQDDSRG